MARIIETENGKRRIIKMSSNDILSIVKEYQRIVPRGIEYNETINHLENVVIYIPEDI